MVYNDNHSSGGSGGGGDSTVQSGEFPWVWRTQEHMPSNPSPALPTIRWVKAGGMTTLTFPSVQYTNSTGGLIQLDVMLPAEIVCGANGPGPVFAYNKFFPPVKYSTEFYGLTLNLNPAEPYASWESTAPNIDSFGNMGGSINLPEVTITYRTDWIPSGK